MDTTLGTWQQLQQPGIEKSKRITKLKKQHQFA